MYELCLQILLTSVMTEVGSAPPELFVIIMNDTNVICMVLLSTPSCGATKSSAHSLLEV